MLTVKQPYACLAPMDGVTDQAYRRIVRKLNPDVILYSEFTSINGIQHSDFVRSRLDYKKEELPYFVQLFGSDPTLFAETAKQMEQQGVSGMDINMGCPSKKIVASQHGSGLMKEKELACRIVEACSNAVSIPVTVKTRLGWSDAEDLNSFITSIIDAGAKIIAIHGRTYKQAYKGQADWNPIYKLKDHISVPVIGNGDLQGKTHALSILENLDGYMIGRAAIGNPWVFWSDEERAKVTIADKVAVMMEHYQFLREIKPERKALIEFRKHISGYIVGFDGAKQCRIMLMEAKDETDFYERVRSFS